jgi:hypothetical protein
MGFLFAKSAKFDNLDGMNGEIADKPVLREKLFRMAAEQFGDFVKAVVDVEREIMAIGADLHADEEAILLERGSVQKNLWGVNIFPEKSGDERIVFNSMINIRPSQGNRSRGVEDPDIRLKIRQIVDKLIVG